MDPTFFVHAHPRVIDVLLRDEKFWYGRTSRTFEQSRSRNFMVVVSGRGTLKMQSGTYPLSIGSAFYFPLGHHIVLETEKSDPLRFYSVHYDFRWIDWDGGTSSDPLPSQEGLPLPIVTPMGELEGFSQRFEQLYDIWREKESGYEWQTKLALLNLWNDVYQMNASRQEGDLARRAITRSMAYIRSHYAEALDRDKLAALVSMSPTYYSVSFKRVTGHTPTQYIMNVRLDKAKEMLVCSDRLVSEIAREVGYADPLYFARVFTRHTGMSPREYRKG